LKGTPASGLPSAEAAWRLKLSAFLRPVGHKPPAFFTKAFHRKEDEKVKHK
jgi:hypothetical protein